MKYLACLAFLMLALPAAAETLTPPIWRVSDADSDIYILGSLHVTPDGAAWRSPEIARAVDQSETFWFEAETDTDAAKQTAKRVLMSEGFLTGDATLSARLGEEDGARLAAIVESVGLPMEAVDRMRPWQAYLALSIQLFANQGYETGGIEKELLGEARARAREMRHLETVDAQLALFTKLDAKAENLLLRQLLRSWDARRDGFPSLVDAWGAGDVAAIDALMNAELREAAPSIYKLLVSKRNAAWAEEITVALEGRGAEMFVIGAAHVAGDGSVIDLLKAQGLEVTRLGVAEEAPAGEREDGEETDDIADLLQE